MRNSPPRSQKLAQNNKICARGKKLLIEVSIPVQVEISILSVPPPWWRIIFKGVKIKLKNASISQFPILSEEKTAKSLINHHQECV